MDIPEVIYKYESFTERSLRNLKSQCIYFGTPLNFNDPYDCAVTPRFSRLSDEDVQELKSMYISDNSVPAAVKQQLLNADHDYLRQHLTAIATEAVENTIRRMLRTTGVACFSERNDDLLMWGHYGGSYKGFCLAFRTDVEPLNKLRRVNYCTDMPTIDIRRVLVDEHFEDVIDLLCTKSNSWKYEFEWRAIHATAGTEFCYQPEALKAIYFGPDIDRQALEIICLIVGGQNDQVEFWRGRRSREKFEVEFEQFFYTSFIESTRK